MTRGRPPKPLHRKPHAPATLTGIAQHRNNPAHYGPICDACREFRREYNRAWEAKFREERKRLHRLLAYDDHGNPWVGRVRHLTTAELDALVRAVRILEDQMSVWEDDSPRSRRTP